MQGVLPDIKAVARAIVTKGQLPFVLEAMKMEVQVMVPRSGTLVQLNVPRGQSVELDRFLAEIE